MYHSGIGGGGFMLIRSPDGTFEDVDFRESAPAAAHQDMFNSDPHLSVAGGLARYVYDNRLCVVLLANTVVQRSPE